MFLGANKSPVCRKTAVKFQQIDLATTTAQCFPFSVAFAVKDVTSNVAAEWMIIFKSHLSSHVSLGSYKEFHPDPCELVLKYVHLPSHCSF